MSRQIKIKQDPSTEKVLAVCLFEDENGNDVWFRTMEEGDVETAVERVLWEAPSGKRW